MALGIRRRRWLQTVVSLAIVGAAVFSSPSADASILISLDLPDLVQQAEQVAVVNVVAVRSQWDESHRRIYSTVDLDVIERWKGTTDLPSRVTVVQPGGTVGDISMVVMGMSSFAVGERSVVFLAGPSQQARVVGMAQGKRSLRFDEPTRTWRVSPPDLRHTELVPQAGGTPPTSKAAARQRTSTDGSSARGDVALDALRTSVLRLVSSQPAAAPVRR